MKKAIVILSALLILQLGMATALRLKQPSHKTSQTRESLLNFDITAVDTITISDSDGVTLRLRKQDNAWRLPPLNDFPADATVVQRLLGKLATLKQGWPVATTATAAQRFKVAADDFERHIILARGDSTVAELFVGTSPGLRKVHVRRPEQQAIYAVTFNTFDAPVKTDDWIDKHITQVEPDQLQRIELPTLTLIHESGNWRLADLKPDEDLLQDETDNLVGQVTTVIISSVLPKAPTHPEEPVLEYTLTMKSGDRQTFSFYKTDDDTAYLLKTSRRQEYFKVPAFYANNIKDSSRGKLVQKR